MEWTFSSFNHLSTFEAGLYGRVDNALRPRSRLRTRQSSSLPQGPHPALSFIEELVQLGLNPNLHPTSTFLLFKATAFHRSLYCKNITKIFIYQVTGFYWLSGKILDSKPRDSEFESRSRPRLVNYKTSDTRYYFCIEILSGFSDNL